MTLNVDMKVGNVSETITVTGEPPIVDLQATTRQTVMTHAQVDALPTGRNMFNLGVLIPGVTLTTGGLANQDVGGALGPNTLALGIHGGTDAGPAPHHERHLAQHDDRRRLGRRHDSQRGGRQRNAFDTSAVDASLSTGGIRINFIAKDGGNQFAGTVFANFANSSMQGSNYTDRLKQAGLATPGGIVKNWDFNPGFGGPIAKDKLWFYLSGRSQGADTLVPNQFYNKNENNLNAWTYVPDTARPAELNRSWQDYQARVTWQANSKNKFGFLYNIQSNCFCPFGISTLTAPEAGNDQRFPLQRPIEVDWTSPVTSKLLLEATAIHRIERWGAMDPSTLAPGMISAVDQGPGAYRPGMTYRAAATYSNNINETFHWRFTASYITGAHAIKVGANDGWGYSDATTYTRQPLAYTFVTPVGAAPTPSTLTEYVTPYTVSTNVAHDFGLFAQDKWTKGRSTVMLGVRFDHASSFYPATTLGPTTYAPNRNVAFPESPQVSWTDVTPKMGYAYDVRGDGRTALKISLNKYLQGFGTSFAIVPDPNPVSAAVGFGNATRTWNDRNHNYVPDCDLSNKTPGANGECGALSNPNFGSNDVAALLNQLKFDPNLQNGYGKRGYNWEFSAGVQQQLGNRMSLDIGFFRRWYGNFQVVDNLALNTATDFNYINLQAPADPRLPGGGNYTVTGFPVVKPSVGFGGFVTNQNVVKLSDDVGRQISHWNGVDVNLNSRLQNGFFAGGGFSTGRTSHRQLRDHQGPARGRVREQQLLQPVLLHHDPDAVLQTGRRVPHAGQGERRLQHPEDRRVGRRHLPGSARRARRGSFERALPARRGWPADSSRPQRLPHHGAGTGDRRPAAPARRQVLEDHPGRTHANADRPRHLQHVQLGHDHGTGQRLHAGARGSGRLAGAEPDSPGAVHQDQRAVRFLVRPEVRWVRSGRSGRKTCPPHLTCQAYPTSQTYPTPYRAGRGWKTGSSSRHGVRHGWRFS